MAKDPYSWILEYLGSPGTYTSEASEAVKRMLMSRAFDDSGESVMSEEEVRRLLEETQSDIRGAYEQERSEYERIADLFDWPASETFEAMASQFPYLSGPDIGLDFTSWFNDRNFNWRTAPGGAPILSWTKKLTELQNLQSDPMWWGLDDDVISGGIHSNPIRGNPPPRDGTMPPPTEISDVGEWARTGYIAVGFNKYVGQSPRDIVNSLIQTENASEDDVEDWLGSQQFRDKAQASGVNYFTLSNQIRSQFSSESERIRKDLEEWDRLYLDPDTGLYDYDEDRPYAPEFWELEDEFDYAGRVEPFAGDVGSIRSLEERIAKDLEEAAGTTPPIGPPPVGSDLAEEARVAMFEGLTDYEDYLEPYGRPAHEYWEGVTAQLSPFWQVRAPAAELGRRLQSRYLLEAPEMAVDPSGISPTFGQYFQDWRPYAAGGFAEGTGPRYYSDPTQLLARARRAGLAGITPPGEFAESYQHDDPDLVRAAWLSGQFGPGVQGAAANQRAVASLLALQRPTGGAYGGQMANAIRNAVFNVQQRREALGADPGSFLHWFADPEARSSPALMAPNIGPEWRQALLKNPVSPIGL